MCTAHLRALPRIEEPQSRPYGYEPAFSPGDPKTDRTPFENFIDGFPLDLARRTLSTDLAELFTGLDVSAYMNMRTAGYLPTAVPPVRQPTTLLGSRPLPEIGSIQAETEHFGTLTASEPHHQVPSELELLPRGPIRSPSLSCPARAVAPGA